MRKGQRKAERVKREEKGGKGRKGKGKGQGKEDEPPPLHQLKFLAAPLRRPLTVRFPFFFCRH